MGLGDSIKRLTQSLGLAKEPVKSEQKESVEETEPQIDLNKLQDSESESEIEQEDNSKVDVIPSDESDEAEEDVALSDVELDDDADVVPHQKVTINNRPALKQSLKSISLPQSAREDFNEHMSVVSSAPVELKDIYDDTERELAFYKQALDAVTVARKQLKASGVAFSRPTDYFAEMVKSDEHMDRVKKKLVDEETSKKASQEARRQRELKKFGKKVQNEKLQQRQVEKRKALEKINSLKKKRQNNDIGGEQFDVEIEGALEDKKQARDEKYRLGSQRGAGGVNKKANHKRQAKNSKYGHGGRKHGMKRNTSESSMDVTGFNSKRRKH